MCDQENPYQRVYARQEALRVHIADTPETMNKRLLRAESIADLVALPSIGEAEQGSGGLEQQIASAVDSAYDLSFVRGSEPVAPQNEMLNKNARSSESIYDIAAIPNQFTADYFAGTRNNSDSANDPMFEVRPFSSTTTASIISDQVLNQRALSAESRADLAALPSLTDARSSKSTNTAAVISGRALSSKPSVTDARSSKSTDTAAVISGRSLNQRALSVESRAELAAFPSFTDARSSKSTDTAAVISGRSLNQRALSAESQAELATLPSFSDARASKSIETAAVISDRGSLNKRARSAESQADIAALPAIAVASDSELLTTALAISGLALNKHALTVDSLAELALIPGFDSETQLPTARVISEVELRTAAAISQTEISRPAPMAS